MKRMCRLGLIRKISGAAETVSMVIAFEIFIGRFCRGVMKPGLFSDRMGREEPSLVRDVLTGITFD